MKKSIFQELVEESIVLLKNEEQILPLKEKKVAFLGRAQIETIFSGNGSGASKSLANKNLLCECEKRGICAEAGLKQFYTSHQKNESEKFVIDGIDITNVENMNCGFMYEIFGKYQPMWTEYHIPEQLMQKAREFTDTAVFVLGRNAGGEECDRHIEGDYELTESEKELLEQVKAKGVNIAHVTLHVGLGTFRPVKVDDVTQHHMHSEHYWVSQEAADLINEAKRTGHRVIAVGTTSCRTLESAYIPGKGLRECSDNTDIFIYPGYQWKCIDALITNFHLPKSTLIMLVSALASKEIILNAYNVAVEEKYRFFSFGDAMFIH